MRDEMTIEDATNVVSVLGDVLACDANEDVRELVTAARGLVRHIAEQSSELERERARRRSLARDETRVPDGNPLEEGSDGGGRRDFLAGRPVHAGEALYLLTCAGWHPVRYESNFPAKEPVLYLPLPGVWQEVVIAVPHECALSLAGRIAAVIEKARIGAIMPREKPHRGARHSDARGLRPEGRLRDREAEALRAIVRTLAREAAREAFERALAEQQENLEDDA